MFCGKCGKKVKDGNTFCTGCGEKINDNALGILEIFGATIEENTDNPNQKEFLENSSSMNNNTLSLNFWLPEYIKVEQLFLELQNNPDNYPVRCNIIEHFAQRIFLNKEFLGRKINFEEMQFLISECRKHITYFDKLDKKDKQVLGIQFATMICNAQMYIIQGDLLNAIRCYNNILKCNDILEKCKDEILVKYSISNLIQLYIILELTDKANMLYSEYKGFFEDEINICKTVLKRNVDQVGSFYDSLYNVIDTLQNYRNGVAFLFCEFYCRDIADDGDPENILYIVNDTSNIYTFYNEQYDFYDSFKFDYFNSHFILYNMDRDILGLDGFPKWNHPVNKKTIMNSDVRKKVMLLF